MDFTDRPFPYPDYYHSGQSVIDYHDYVERKGQIYERLRQLDKYGAQSTESRNRAVYEMRELFDELKWVEQQIRELRPAARSQLLNTQRQTLYCIDEHPEELANLIN